MTPEEYIAARVKAHIVTRGLDRLYDAAEHVEAANTDANIVVMAPEELTGLATGPFCGVSVALDDGRLFETRISLSWGKMAMRGHLSRSVQAARLKPPIGPD